MQRTLKHLRPFTQAPNTASQTSEARAPLVLTLEVANCSFLIWSANSMPLIVMAAFLNLLNPNIG
jgi:hypothetical protein